MTTIHLDFEDSPTPPPATVCCACRRQPAACVITYAGRVHEPHCEGCSESWQHVMLGAAIAGVLLLMHDFRAWQAQRARLAC